MRTSIESIYQFLSRVDWESAGPRSVESYFRDPNRAAHPLRCRAATFHLTLFGVMQELDSGRDGRAFSLRRMCPFLVCQAPGCGFLPQEPENKGLGPGVPGEESKKAWRPFFQGRGFWFPCAGSVCMGRRIIREALQKTPCIHSSILYA